MIIGKKGLDSWTHIILDEVHERNEEMDLILLIVSREMYSNEFQANHYPNIDDDTKAKIFQLNDLAEDIKKLDTDTVEKLVSKDPLMMIYKEAKTDVISKIFRIICGNIIQICGDEDLYDTTEVGVYHNIARINHSCVPNVTPSWVMGDFERQQVRAIMAIEKDQEILISYRNTEEFILRSREFRRQQLLEDGGFLCECSECSLEGEDLEDNDGIRAEIREKTEEIIQLTSSESSFSRRAVKKAMKLFQRRVKLLQKLNIRTWFVAAMINFYQVAVRARMMGIHCENDPNVFKQEALKYARMFGDYYLHFYNNYSN